MGVLYVARSIICSQRRPTTHYRRVRRRLLDDWMKGGALRHARRRRPRMQLPRGSELPITVSSPAPPNLTSAHRSDVGRDDSGSEGCRVCVSQRCTSSSASPRGSGARAVTDKCSLRASSQLVPRTVHLGMAAAGAPVQSYSSSARHGSRDLDGCGRRRVRRRKTCVSATSVCFDCDLHHVDDGAHVDEVLSARRERMRLTRSGMESMVMVMPYPVRPTGGRASGRAAPPETPVPAATFLANPWLGGWRTQRSKSRGTRRTATSERRPTVGGTATVML